MDVEALFEEVCSLFEDDVRDGATKTAEAFCRLVEDNMPFDALEELKQIMGVEDGGDESSFITDIFDERWGSEDAGTGEEGETICRLLCEICERYTKLTRHHLYPRQLHAKLASRVPAAELSRTISICRMCHATVHRLFSNDELAASYHTLETLMDTEAMEKYAKWASKQKGAGDRRVL